MKKSFKSTYRKLLCNNPAKARKHKILLLTGYRNFLEEIRYLKRNSNRLVRKEGR